MYLWYTYHGSLQHYSINGEHWHSMNRKDAQTQVSTCNSVWQHSASPQHSIQLARNNITANLYIYIYMYIYIYLYTYIHTRYIHIYMYIYIYIYVYTHIHVHILYITYALLHTYVCVCIYIYIYIYISLVSCVLHVEQVLLPGPLSESPLPGVEILSSEGDITI